MRGRVCLSVMAVSWVMCLSVAHAQSAPPADVAPQPVPATPADSLQPGSQPAATAAPLTVTSPVVAEFAAFNDADVKFSLNDLMDILQDKRHEGWVLAAYPDPKTSRPLIGAGFSLDLPAREHAQTDPLNPHPFLEPSSASLWQTAGLDADRLNKILAQFSENLEDWRAKKFRKKIATLAPQITEDEARSLLRIGIVQAIYNARGYCRNFDRLSASQQMALTQLVYQMGFNLQEFSQFLSLVNSDSALTASSDAGVELNLSASYWKAVQDSLIQSQWARLYRARAVAVIAMLDPGYADAPSAAEHKVSAVLHPRGLRRGRKAGASMRNAALTAHGSRGKTRTARHAKLSKGRHK